MIRRPPRSTLDRSSAASDVYKRQDLNRDGIQDPGEPGLNGVRVELYRDNGNGIVDPATDELVGFTLTDPAGGYLFTCLLYTSDAADERSSVDLGGRRIIKKKIKKTSALAMHHRSHNDGMTLRK